MLAMPLPSMAEHQEPPQMMAYPIAPNYIPMSVTLFTFPNLKYSISYTHVKAFFEIF